MKGLKYMVCGLWSALLLLISCEIQPPLHLPSQVVEARLPQVRLQLDILWQYNFVIDSITGEIIDSTYNWREDFAYGWDNEDERIFGAWDIKQPELINIRRYYTGSDPEGPHTAPTPHQVSDHHLVARYNYGFYDILAWNEVTTIDGVQSLHFDEESTYEYVTAYTNKGMNRVHYSSRQPYAYYQPEFLYAGYYQNLQITDDPNDYDFLDTINGVPVYVKNLEMELLPVTYIYVTQIILHNNRGRVSGVDGNANLQGMAYSTNLNTGVTGSEPISVSYHTRLKNNVNYKGENVDIIGGRLFTFGLCNLNPSRASRAAASEENIRNYIDLNMQFNNNTDSILVFDVTDKVHERYKGGILTIHIDVDTLRIPSRPGGSGFDAVVEDFEEKEYEFDM